MHKVGSQIARLLSILTPKDKRKDFVDIVKVANGQLRTLKPVEKSEAQMNGTLANVAGSRLRQTAALSFTTPTFDELRRAVQASVDELSVRQNGLGYNNLLFTSTVFSSLQEDRTLSLRLFLVEEPEAHLHPHLQQLLVQYLMRQCERVDLPTQVILTAHSTHVASTAPLEACTVVSRVEGTGGRRTFRVSAVATDERELRKMARYLDATRGALLFARSAILVEGMSEVLLIPRIGKLLGLDLKEHATSIINMGGLDFQSFMKLAGPAGLNIRCAVVTDSDGRTDGGRYYPGADDPLILSDTAKQLVNAAADPVRVYPARSTLEYDLCLASPANLEAAIEAVESIHRVIGKEAREGCARLELHRDKARCFHERCFVQSDVSKVEFAEALVERIDSRKTLDAPDYIEKALRYVCDG